MRTNSTILAAAGGVLVEKTAPRQEVVAALNVEEGARVGRVRAERDAAGPAPLGNNAYFAPPPLPFYGLGLTTNVRGDECCAIGPTAEIALPAPATAKNYRLRSYGHEILTRAGVAKRVRWCGRRISRGQDGVGVYARPDRAYGRVQGVCVCGQSLCCPVCAPRIAAFRSAEVAECFKRATAAGYEARLLTFTIPHRLGSSLGDEIDVFSTAWRRFNKGKQADKRRCGSLGHHVGREVTYGVNGWHYHHHVLWYGEPGTFCEHRVRSAWLTALESVGRKWRGVEEHAFDSGIVGSEAGASYVGKLATAVEAQARAIGSEIASASTKGKNLATLLLAASVGDDAAGQVWLHGVSEIIRRKVSSVRWSRGLKARVGMEADKSDEQVALEEVLPSDVFLGALTPAQWRGVLHHRAEFALCCAANQGIEKVNSFLAGLSLGQLNDEAQPPCVVPLQAESCYSLAGLPAGVLARMQEIKNASV